MRQLAGIDTIKATNVWSKKAVVMAVVPANLQPPDSKHWHHEMCVTCLHTILESALARVGAAK